MIEIVGPDAVPAIAAQLAPVLIDTIEGGAGVGWVEPPSTDEAVAWWIRLLNDPAAVTWIARDGERILGTITLVRAAYSNGRHRADVIKLMVHRAGRGRGIAPALMGALERFAASVGVTLLVLDTHTGSLAESLYRRWGWQTAGEIPGFAVNTDGTLGSTTVMYKQLAGVSQEHATD
ncbi:GNAT family N-acetyltransferase [Leifsonia sp. NPDC058230]|uniref:GNAT family N-acetyltransferase n=1 Tax=Leifsonia sp. NPDC058230 TaxID=3346391 RepID=UPI0036DCB524